MTSSLVYTNDVMLKIAHIGYACISLIVAIYMYFLKNFKNYFLPYSKINWILIYNICIDLGPLYGHQRKNLYVTFTSSYWIFLKKFKKLIFSEPRELDQLGLVFLIVMGALYAMTKRRLCSSSRFENIAKKPFSKNREIGTCAPRSIKSSKRIVRRFSKVTNKINVQLAQFGHFWNL